MFAFKNFFAAPPAKHAVFREESRWPGYYYRTGHAKLDDTEWHAITASRYNPKTGSRRLSKILLDPIID